MIPVRSTSDPAVRCPSCDREEYFVYRRQPGGEGHVRNLCRCRCCDGSFVWEEDRTGRILSVAKS
jgi:hypothetical protein